MINIPQQKTYRGWTISLEPDGWLHATSPDYDASYEGPEDGWIDNGLRCSAKNMDDLREEIDFAIEEMTP